MRANSDIRPPVGVGILALMKAGYDACGLTQGFTTLTHGGGWKIQDAGLVVIGDGTSLEFPGNSALILLAQQFGLKFITGNDPSVKDVTRGDVPSMHERALPTEGVRPHFAESLTIHSYRFIGIND